MRTFKKILVGAAMSLMVTGGIVGITAGAASATHASAFGELCGYPAFCGAK